MSARIILSYELSSHVGKEVYLVYDDRLRKKFARRESALEPFTSGFYTA